MRIRALCLRMTGAGACLRREVMRTHDCDRRTIDDAVPEALRCEQRIEGLFWCLIALDRPDQRGAAERIAEAGNLQVSLLCEIFQSGVQRLTRDIEIIALHGCQRLFGGSEPACSK